MTDKKPNEVCQLCGYIHRPKFNKSGTIMILDWDKEALKKHREQDLKILFELSEEYGVTK